MKKLYKTVSLLIVALFVFSSMSFMGCTKRPNVEQYKRWKNKKMLLYQQKILWRREEEKRTGFKASWIKKETNFRQQKKN